jgi:hypothetical protein
MCRLSNQDHLDHNPPTLSKTYPYTLEALAHHLASHVESKNAWELAVGQEVANVNVYQQAYGYGRVVSGHRLITIKLGLSMTCHEGIDRNTLTCIFFSLGLIIVLFKILILIYKSISHILNSFYDKSTYNKIYGHS